MKSIGTIIVFIFCLLFISCKKKYEEDPKKTTKSPEKRLVGSWKLTDYTFNGSSIVNQLNALDSSYKIENVTFNFSKTKDEDKKWNLAITADSKELYMDYAALVNDKYILVTAYGIDAIITVKWFSTPFRYNKPLSDTYWIITKLYKNDLHLKLSTDSGDYKIFLNKIGK
jgi:hypothetical protein